MGIMKNKKSVIVFILGVAACIIVLAMATLMLPSRITVAKSVVIKAPPQKVMSQLDNFSSWKNWYPPMQKKEVQAITNGPSQITLKDQQGKQVNMQMRTATPDTVEVQLQSSSAQPVNYQFLLRKRQDGDALLTLNVNIQYKWYSLQKIRGVFQDKISGPQYDQVLRQIKKVAEQP